MASAPEVGMPTASPFDKEKADQQAAGAVCNASTSAAPQPPPTVPPAHHHEHFTLTNKGSAPAP
ncbi:hypothetical protein QJS66_17265 [Kocuria rhizophila]|nr:hypothetical protein QJS66_17265 [Kocuria rhizophila]